MRIFCSAESERGGGGGGGGEGGLRELMQEVVACGAGVEWVGFLDGGSTW